MLDNFVPDSDNFSNENEKSDQEEWMILSDYHKLNNDAYMDQQKLCDWHLDSKKYTTQQIAEMPDWVSDKE